MRTLCCIAAVCLTAYGQVPPFVIGGGGGGTGSGAPNASGTLAADGTQIDIAHTFSVEAAAKSTVNCYSPVHVLLPGTSPTITKSFPSGTTIRVTFGATQPAGTYCNVNGTGTGSPGIKGDAGDTGAPGAPGVIQQIQEEGGDLPQRATINFTGPGIACADTGGITQCTASGGGGTGDVSGGSTLTTVDNLTRVSAAGTVGEATSIKRSGTGATERLHIYNTAGPSGIDIRKSPTAQGTTPFMRFLDTDGVGVLGYIGPNGGVFSTLGIVACEGVGCPNERAAVRPDLGFIAGVGRYVGFTAGQSYGTPDICLGRYTGGVSTGEITNCAGTQADLRLRTLTATTIAGAPAITDLTNANHTHISSATGGTLTEAAWTGIVPVSKGGLGVGTITGVLKGNGTAPIGPVTGNPTDCIFVSGSSGPCPGGGSLTWEQDNTTIGARSIVNVVAGNGINRILTDTGTQIDDQSNIDTAVVQTRQADLLNVDRVITTTSTGTCTFAGTTPISFGLSYPASAGMQLYFTPNMTCDVPTLNVNGLGAKNMYVSNGVHALPTSVGLPQIIAWDPSLNAGAGGWRQAGRVMPFYVTYVAAVCQGAAASMGFTLPPTNAATAVCVTGNQSPNPVIYAVAQFPNGANQIAVQGHFFLPYDWIGVIDVVGKWRTGEVNTSQGVSWQIQTNCVMNNQQAETPAWNPVTVIPREAVISTTAFRHNDFAQGAIDVTNCAAGEELFFRFVRDPNHADDDLAGTAELIQLTFITRRTV